MKEKSHHRHKCCRGVKEDVDISPYFTQAAIRDNIMAHAMKQYLAEEEFLCVVCSSKAAFDCNVSVEGASLHLDLLSGEELKDCKQTCGRHQQRNDRSI